MDNITLKQKAVTEWLGQHPGEAYEAELYAVKYAYWYGESINNPEPEWADPPEIHSHNFAQRESTDYVTNYKQYRQKGYSKDVALACADAIENSSRSANENEILDDAFARLRKKHQTQSDREREKIICDARLVAYAKGIKQVNLFAGMIYKSDSFSGTERRVTDYQNCIMAGKTDVYAHAFAFLSATSDSECQQFFAEQYELEIKRGTADGDAYSIATTLTEECGDGVGISEETLLFTRARAWEKLYLRGWGRTPELDARVATYKSKHPGKSITEVFWDVECERVRGQVEKSEAQ